MDIINKDGVRVPNAGYHDQRGVFPAMKKMLVLLAALLLALPLAAGAEDAAYIRQLPQDTYVRASLIAEESYPEVCLTTAYTGRIFGKDAEAPLFLCFPGPSGVLANRVEDDYVHFLDSKNKIQYSYQLMSSDSYEEFINKAEKDEYILLDGSDKTAAYLSPSRSNAYGMIGVPAFGKSAKLRITISLDYFGYKTADESKVGPLSDIILAEIARVKAAMRTEQKAPYWNCDTFAGIKLLAPQNDACLVKIDFPDLAGSGAAPKVIVTSINDARFSLIYSYEPGIYAETNIEINDYSYAANKLAENAEDCYKTELANGSEWIVYFTNRRDDGTSNYVYIAKALTDPLIASDAAKPVYFTALLNGHGIAWTEEEIKDILARFDACYTVMKAADDPYVPGEKPAAPETSVAPEMPVGPDEPAGPDTSAPADAAWTCPSCGAEGNTGKFCPECGTPKPESAEWTCPGCGAEGNIGKFCPNCGAAKP